MKSSRILSNNSNELHQPCTSMALSVVKYHKALPYLAKLYFLLIDFGRKGVIIFNCITIGDATWLLWILPNKCHRDDPE